MAQSDRAGKRFALYFTGGLDVKNSILKRFDKVRDAMQPNSSHKILSTEVLDMLLDFYFRHSMPNQQWTNTYVPVSKDNTNQQLFVTSQTSIQKILDLASHHSQVCNNKLTIKSVTMRGHVAITKMRCERGYTAHQYNWSSSPYLPDGQFLANARIFHGFSCSGMLPIHYKRLSEGANMGVISDEKRKRYFDIYYDCVEKLGEQSQLDALMIEIASYAGLEEEIEVPDEEGEPMIVQ
jgi:hypothetical protein